MFKLKVKFVGLRKDGMVFLYVISFFFWIYKTETKIDRYLDYRLNV